MQDQSRRVLENFNKVNASHSIISEDELCKQLQENLSLTVEGVKLALHYLFVNRQASFWDTMVDSKEVRLYKLAPSANDKVDEITPIELSIYTLGEMEKSLTKSAESIETVILKTDEMVRKYVREKKKQMAKNLLRKKHALEKNLGWFLCFDFFITIHLAN